MPHTECIHRMYRLHTVHCIQSLDWQQSALFDLQKFSICFDFWRLSILSERVLRWCMKIVPLVCSWRPHSNRINFKTQTTLEVCVCVCFKRKWKNDDSPWTWFIFSRKILFLHSPSDLVLFPCSIQNALGSQRLVTGFWWKWSLQVNSELGFKEFKVTFSTFWIR